MGSRWFARLITPLAVALVPLSASCASAGLVPLDAPFDFGTAQVSPTQGTWAVISCTKSTSCPITITVSSTGPTTPNTWKDCSFSGVPDAIDVRPASPRIDWRLLSGTAGKTYSFGWRGPAGNEFREGIRIRGANAHDEDDGQPAQPGPALSSAFDRFNRVSDIAGHTGLRNLELQQPAMHRMFYYRLHVDEIDGAGNRAHCRFRGPMILNRG